VVKKPRQFTLKDLPKYSQTLKYKDNSLLSKLLASKGMGSFALKIKKTAGVPEIHEWSKTPLYLEMAAGNLLIHSKTTPAGSKGSKELHESEIEYWLNLAKKQKKDDFAIESKDKIFSQSLDTLEIYMTRLGLHSVCKKIREQYLSEKRQDLKETLIKLLTRCRLVIEHARQVTSIFRAIKRRD